MRMIAVAHCACSDIGLVVYRVLGLMLPRDQGHASTAAGGGAMFQQKHHAAAYLDPACHV